MVQPHALTCSDDTTVKDVSRTLSKIGTISVVMVTGVINIQ